jgi:hypothetical protein
MLPEMALGRPTAVRSYRWLANLFACSHRPKKIIRHPVWKGSQISLRDYFFVTWIWPYDLTTALFLSPSNAGVERLQK